MPRRVILSSMNTLSFPAVSSGHAVTVQRSADNRKSKSDFPR